MTCSCGKPSSHSTLIPGGVKYQCCECYVKAGNPPADWHPLCMKTYEAMRAQPSAMSFELGLDHIVLNGHRIARPSGVSRSSWDKFWSRASWHIIDLH